MGVSGVLLLLTGLVYTVIGIKNKWYVADDLPYYLDSPVPGYTSLALLPISRLLL